MTETPKYGPFGLWDHKPQALHRLDQQSGVRLVAAEKQGQDALEDEAANRKAICIVDADE
jgi:23S rRNA-/tRNA-specific pseudouridylate synthase